jgi:hypothetical protein
MGTPSRRAPEVNSEEGLVRSARASWREVFWAGDKSGALGESVVMVSILVLVVLRYTERVSNMKRSFQKGLEVRWYGGAVGS